jgi:hypothetical protein
MRRIFYALFIMAVFSGCVSRRPAVVSNWDDATLIANQRAEIDQLRRNLTDMGNVIGEVSGRIDSLTEGLANGIERCENIEDIFRVVDQFVRKLIDENNQLRNLQPADWGTDAGEGSRSGDSVSGIGRTGQYNSEIKEYQFEADYSGLYTWAYNYWLNCHYGG